MKTIEISDEMYEFLINLSNELNTQNHRCTAMPYFFQIESEETVPAADGCGTMGWYCDGTTLTEDNEIKDAIFEHKEWELENPEHEKLFNELYDWEIDEIMEENYRKIWFDTQKIYQNAFLTEKACREHIRLNDYHYCEPVDYLSHAFRNPELEKVLEFLCSLTGGQIHK
jgi:hypothetical protein